MYDITRRMEQWSSANQAQHFDEVPESLRQDPPTEPMTKSTTVIDRARPFIRSSPPKYDIVSRMDAWDKSDKAKESVIHANLTASSPFKRSEEDSAVIQQLMQEDPETLVDLLEKCVEELETRADAGASEASDETPDTPKKDDTDDSPKKKDEEESDGESKPDDEDGGEDDDKPSSE